MQHLFKLVLASFLALLLSACGRGPDSTAIDYIRAVADGNHDAAISMIDPDKLDMEKGKIKAALRMQKDTFDTMGGIKNIAVDNEKTEGERAVVAVKVKFGNGTSEIFNVALKKIDGKWKVSSVE